MANPIATKARARKARAKAGVYQHRSKASNPDVAIVGLKEGGLGWRVTDKGSPVKLRFGRVFAPDDPKANAKLAVSMKAIDRALREVSSGRAGVKRLTPVKRLKVAVPAKASRARRGDALRFLDSE